MNIWLDKQPLASSAQDEKCFLIIMLNFITCIEHHYLHHNRDDVFRYDYQFSSVQMKQNSDTLNTGCISGVSLVQVSFCSRWFSFGSPSAKRICGPAFQCADVFQLFTVNRRRLHACLSDAVLIMWPCDDDVCLWCKHCVYAGDQLWLWFQRKCVWFSLNGDLCRCCLVVFSSEDSVCVCTI